VSSRDDYFYGIARRKVKKNVLSNVQVKIVMSIYLSYVPSATRLCHATTHFSRSSSEFAGREYMRSLLW
jgi:hypothetical protein